MHRTTGQALTVSAGVVLILHLLVQAVCGQEYVEYRNEKFKFGAKLPAHWMSEVNNTPGKSARIFSGHQGTVEYYTTINFQVVIRKGDEGNTVREKELVGQWKTAPKFKMLARDEGTLAGQPALRLVVVYQMPGGKEMYGQEQYITHRGPYFFLIGYTAPGNLFDKYQPIMENAINSFRFLP